METITVVLEAETIAMLDASARMRALSREAALTEAIKRMRTDDLLLEESVAEGRDCIDRGDLYTQEQVEADNAILREKIMGTKWR